jgi:hypothetical protein
MKRVLVVAIGVSVAAAAAWSLVSRILAPPHQLDSTKAEVPLYLQQSADCMYQALKAIPGVNQPMLRYEYGDGWNHPVLGYLAAWRDGVYQITFAAQRPMTGHDKYWFLNSFPGPPPPGLDMALMESVMNNWRTRCKADVGFEIN